MQFARYVLISTSSPLPETSGQTERIFLNSLTDNGNFKVTLSPLSNNYDGRYVSVIECYKKIKKTRTENNHLIISQEIINTIATTIELLSSFVGVSTNGGFYLSSPLNFCYGFLPESDTEKEVISQTLGVVSKAKTYSMIRVTINLIEKHEFFWDRTEAIGLLASILPSSNPLTESIYMFKIIEAAFGTQGKDLISPVVKFINSANAVYGWNVIYADLLKIIDKVLLDYRNGLVHGNRFPIYGDLDVAFIPYLLNPLVYDLIIHKKKGPATVHGG